LALAALFWLAWLSQTLLLIFAIFAAACKPPSNQLSRIWKVSHAVRLTAVCCCSSAWWRASSPLPGSPRRQAQTLRQPCRIHWSPQHDGPAIYNIDLGQGSETMAALQRL
jgi:hypothetical protein